MSVRANWHLASLDDAEEADPMADLLNLAKPFDLSQGRAQLSEQMRSLIRAEAALFERTGAECDLKDKNDHSCFTCPHYAAGPDDGHWYEVCRIGRSQHTIIDQLRRHDEVEELEALAFKNLMDEECWELAEYVLAE